MANRRRPRSRLHAVMRCGLLALLILFVLLVLLTLLALLVFLILLILLVQLFQTVGTKLAVKCDKRLKK